MGRPNFRSQWASDIEWSDPGEAWDVTENKIEPGATEKTQGAIPNQAFAANHLNYMFNGYSSAFEYLVETPIHNWGGATSFSGVNGAFQSVYAPDGSMIFIVGNGDAVKFTGDYGRVLTSINPPGGANVALKSFAENATRMLVASDVGDTYYTKDWATFGSWTTRTFPNAGKGATRLFWMPNTSNFVALGGDTTTMQLLTSSDGITWTSRTVPTALGTGTRSKEIVACSVEDSAIVALHKVGDVQRGYYLYSLDGGATWAYASGPSVVNMGGGSYGDWRWTDPVYSPGIGYLAWAYDDINTGKSQLWRAAPGAVNALSWTHVADYGARIDSITCNGALWLSTYRSTTGAGVMYSTDFGQSWRYSRHRMPATAGGGNSRLALAHGCFVHTEAETGNVAFSCPTGAGTPVPPL